MERTPYNNRPLTCLVRAPSKLYFETIFITLLRDTQAVLKNQKEKDMTDILLDQQGGHWVVVDAGAFKVAGTDVLLDSPARKGGRPGLRRALVHDHNDSLTLNYNKDYTGGVTIENARVRLMVNSGPTLPKEGRIGELYLMETVHRIDGTPIGAITSLWLCVSPPAPNITNTATWREISLGDSRPGG